MKKLITSFLLILFFTFTNTAWASLKDLVEKKSKNYQSFELYYISLLNQVIAKDTNSFCSQVTSEYSVLVQIFNDDNALISELRHSSNPDFLDYATHLEENSYSPLFSYGSFQDACVNNPSAILKLSESLGYDIENIRFLEENHQQWLDAYGPF